MKWKRKIEPRNGDYRIKKRFLWFPVTLVNESTKELETRWLESVYILQVFRERIFKSGDWRNLRFVGKDYAQKIITWPKDQHEKTRVLFALINGKDASWEVDGKIVNVKATLGG